MPKLRVSLKHKGSEILILAKDPQEVERLLESVPNLFKKIEDVMQKMATTEEEASYRDVIRLDESGAPILKVIDSDLTDKESIMLLLYAVGDNGLKTGDIGTQLNLSGRVAKGYPARITELRREGVITRKSSGEYLLTEKGKMMARDLIRRLKEVVQQ